MKQEKENCKHCDELRFVNEEGFCAECWKKRAKDDEEEEEEENSGSQIVEYDQDAEDSRGDSDHEYGRFCDQIEKIENDEE